MSKKKKKLRKKAELKKQFVKAVTSIADLQAAIEEKNGSPFWLTEEEADINYVKKSTLVAARERGLIGYKKIGKDYQYNETALARFVEHTYRSAKDLETAASMII